MKKGPKEGEEETDLTSNKEEHSNAQTTLHFIGVFPLECCLTTHVPPSLNHSHEDENQTDYSQVPIESMKPARQTANQKECAA